MTYDFTQSTATSERSVMSFFSGAMGLDLGLKNSGLNIAAGQELDKHAVETIRANGHSVLPGDLRKILQDDPNLEQLHSLAGSTRGSLFAAVGGPPCQSFSTAGRRLGLDDERGMLIFDYLDAIKALMPRFVVLENVKGILTAAGQNNESLIDEIIDYLKAAGYTSVVGVVDASHYGAAQFRERVIIIGSRDNEPIFIPTPSHFQVHQLASHRWQTLSSRIKDIEHDPGEGAQFSSKIQDVLKLVPEGGNWRSLPPEIAEPAMGGAWKSGGGKVGFFRKLSYSEPSPTLVTSPVQKATMLAHPTQCRPLSVKEYARIQGFPDSWQITGTTAAKYKQIGNAVPVALGEAIGSMLIAVADGTSTISTRRLRGTKTHSKLATVGTFATQ